MTTVRYFAYGSNMLTARLQHRCASASVLTPARAPQHRVAFCKRSVDGSGKAALVAADAGEGALGVVFEVAARELSILDEFEGAAYQRCDFAVRSISTGEEVTACTYLAREHWQGLRPYDWYLALVLAGIAEHGLDRGYASALCAGGYEIDERPERAGRLAALRAFRCAGIGDYRTLLVDGGYG